MSWSWSALWPALSAIGGFGVLLFAVGGAIWRGLRRISAQNTEQLRKQLAQEGRDARFRREWYGVQAGPGTPAEPGVVERLARIESNTQSLPDRMAAAEGRLVHLEASLTDHVVKGHGSP